MQQSEQHSLGLRVIALYPSIKTRDSTYSLSNRIGGGGGGRGKVCGLKKERKKKWKDATALLIRINKRLFKGVHYDNLQIRNSSSDPLVNAVS